MRDLLVGGLSQLLEIVGQSGLLGSYDAPSFTVSIISVIVFIAIILACIGAIVALLQYRFFTFKLDEFDIRLRKGIFTIQEITIPYRQMQNVDVVRNLLYRIFGISRLVIMSAGQDDDPYDKAVTSTIFDPIEKDIAEEIRRLLERRIGVQIVEDMDEIDKEMTQKDSVWSK